MGYIRFVFQQFPQSLSKYCYKMANNSADCWCCLVVHHVQGEPKKMPQWMEVPGTKKEGPRINTGGCQRAEFGKLTYEAPHCSCRKDKTCGACLAGRCCAV